MSTLYVVRHGQAGRLLEDYDRLSELGREQARALADFWLQRGLVIDQAWSGELRRQTDTAAEVAARYAALGRQFPPVTARPAFDEYPAETILTSLGEHLRETDADIGRLAEACESAAQGTDGKRAFNRLFEAVIGRWIAGDHRGFEPAVSWSDWSDAVRDALRDLLASAGRGTATALFTSGGVVAVTVQTILEAPARKAADLNWRIHNASVTRFTFSGERISLDRFNDVAHLAPSQLTYR
jgi:broad specificity phosphatase PhoE